MNRCLATALVFTSLAFCPGLAAATFPFQVGEEIRYEVRWQMVQAGQAEVRVLPFVRMGGQEAYHFELQVRTNRFLDKIYKVRDHLEGFVARDFSRSLAYRYTGTGRKKKKIQVVYSPGAAAYTNFDEVRDPIETPDRCFDPMSSFFKLRTLAMEAHLSFPVSDGKKAFLQEGEVLGTETLTLASGIFETLVIAPRVTHFSGVFEKSEDPTVRVWVTKDSQRIPVRIRIRVKVGSIFFDLASYSPGSDPGGPALPRTPDD